MAAWLPLESNPEVLNPFIRRLGVPSDWEFTDVFGLDEELLAMLPQPCAALCLLFPSKNISEAHREAMRAKRPTEVPAPVFFLQQHDDMGNACGTIAAVHAVANAAAAGNFALQDGPLRGFLDKAAPLSIPERGMALHNASEMQELSDATAASGETEGAGTDDAQGQHFIAFVPVAGQLYELDGRTFDEHGVAFPVCHGPTTSETFVKDAAKVIREEFMARDPASINFNITALCKAA
eukprot:CAMPEP_0119060790 /NCGR_PEP_ID=MMETSP1178-20130426/4699_1 /TAXON_ID=33656 /ORGANISM="unid sp, Strain CCMP2000" /LENGTH=236 /DNA_ID=CAMNT_0007041927 /DNA_START=48 /DNA_END=758 /DNA_ORIENTATION=-